MIVLLFFSSMTLHAQGIGNILIAAGDDAKTLTQNYMDPGLKCLVYSLNSGWATTAKTHSKFGFDVTIGASFSFVPRNEQEFLFDSNDYEFLTLPAASSGMLPTVMSEDSQQSILDVRVPDGNGAFKVASIKMPGGIAEDLPANSVPAPLIQLGFGLPTRTDVKFRIVPNMEYGDKVKAGVLGIGLQHDFTQYMGFVDSLPLSISGLIAFSNMNVTYKIDDDSDNVTLTNGEGAFNLNTFAIEVLGSLDFPFITLLAGIGYGVGSSSLELKGVYELRYELEDNSGNSLGNVSETIIDPINLETNNASIRARLGGSFNLSVFKIFIDYTLQEYSTFTGGIAVSVR